MSVLFDCFEGLVHESSGCVLLDLGGALHSVARILFQLRSLIQVDHGPTEKCLPGHNRL